MAKMIKNAIIGAVVVFAVVATGGAALSIAGFTVTYAAQMAALSFLGSMAMGGIAALSGKPNAAASENFGTKVAGRGAAMPRQIIYGQCRVGGTITQMHTTGDDNVKLSIFIVLSGHAINGLVSVRFDDVTATSVSSTVSGETVHVVTNSAFTNAENEHDFTDANSTAGRLIRYTFHDGTQNAHDGLARATLGATFVPDAQKFKTCAYVYLEMIYDQDKLTQMPQMSFVVQGKKVFDPRDNSTAYSANPALCIRDYISDTVYGLKANAAEINDTTAGGGFASAANTCDVDVTLADNSTTTDQYICGGFISMATSGEEALDVLLSSCGGNITYTNGKFNLFVGAAQTPSLTITDADLLEPVAIQTKPPSGTMFNATKAIFIDSTSAYKATDTPIFEDSTLLTADTPSGETEANYKKMMELKLPFTTTQEAAQRIARIALLLSRNTITLSVVVGLNFLKAQPHDWIYITNSRLGFDQKIFEILTLELTQVGGDEAPIMAVKLNLRETAAASYGFAYNAYTAPVASATGMVTAHKKTVGAANIIDLSVNTNVIFDNAVTSTILSATNMAGFSTGSTGTHSLTISMVEDGVAYTGEVIVNAFVVQGTSASGGATGTLFNVTSGNNIIGLGLANAVTYANGAYVYTGQADSTMRLYLNPTSVGTTAGSDMTIMTSFLNSSIYTLSQPMTLFGRSAINATQLASASSFTAKVTFGVNNWVDPAFQVIWQVIRKFK